MPISIDVLGPDAVRVRNDRGASAELRTLDDGTLGVSALVAPPTVPVVRPPTLPPPLPPMSGFNLASLGVLPAELVGLRLPARPTTKYTSTVRDDGGARIAASQPGTKIIVAATLSHIDVTASDVEIVAGTYRCGTLTIGRGVRRVAVSGGQWTNYESGGADYSSGASVWRASDIVEDVTLENMQLTASKYAFKILSGRRIALVGCRVVAGEYSLWAEYSNGSAPLEDLVVSGCRFSSSEGRTMQSIPGPESTCRITGVQRAMIVDTRFQNPAKHCLRVHGRSDRVFISRCNLVGGGSMLGFGMPGDALAWVGLDHVAFYSTTDDLLQVGAMVATLRDCTAYRADARALVTAHPGWTIERCTTKDYVAPPA